MIKLFLASLIATSANARPLTHAERECVFKSPLSFGASITAETAAIIPGYSGVIAARALTRGIPYVPSFGVSPNRILLASYARKLPWAHGPNISRMFTQSDEDYGSAQVDAMLTGKYSKEFERSSVVIGLDAFYWDAISNNCGGPAGADSKARTLIQQAHAKGKVLILGTIPTEDPSKVLIDSESLGIHGLWYNPEKPCLDQINAVLRADCKPAKNCYLINIEAMVSTLNEGGTLSVGGKDYSLYWIRPDGVHLSLHGSEYLYRQTVQALESSPPKCPAPSSKD